MRKIVLASIAVVVAVSGAAHAEEKEAWKAPFGGTFTAGFAVLNDYSYRGISQTQRQVAVQAAFGYETPTVSEKIPLSAYVGAWGSNVNFPGTGTTAEIDLLTGLRLKAFDDKFTADLGYIRYNYLSAAYTGTNLSVQDCLGTQNCASRVIVGLSKSF